MVTRENSVVISQKNTIKKSNHTNTKIDQNTQKRQRIKNKEQSPAKENPVL